LIIGILALQGDFDLQRRVFENLGQKTILIKYPEQLKQCDGLVIPGGESTTMSLHMRSTGLFDPLWYFAESHPIMGTCAGAILLSRGVEDPRVRPLQIMNIDCRRNSWGRQVFSFQEEISLSFDAEPPFLATFIRAPKFRPTSDNIELLAQLNGEPILVKDGHHLAVSFHPEIGSDYRIHEYFMGLFT